MNEAVVFSNLEKKFDSVKTPIMALDEVSFKVHMGEFFGLLGPNGAGKTTLINVLGGLTRPTKGTAFVFGMDVLKEPQRVRRAIGIVPQELVFDPFFTVKELLRIQSGFFGIKDNDLWIEECLFELGLEQKTNANMRSLSGGMKRRVLIAQALIHKPPVIVLDEPTAGVDVELRENLWKFIKKLNNLGHTIILTTHYLEEAEELCNRVAFMNQGKLSSIQNVADFVNQPGGIRTVFKQTLETI
ncbi:MAG: ABC transporter ATP-binding protein [Betaproteobacteria bacterium TMED41]|nr:MAG: ABC transporter ATP-binding protein [Betaproteobacteria bacterium TMED41]|tara:strand:+ start:3285 stop:4013 length:729 start_codon:yes stop_codon:yes gene_type:complete